MKSISLLASLAAVSVVCLTASCSSKSDGGAGAAGSGAGGGSAGTSTGGDGTGGTGTGGKGTNTGGSGTGVAGSGDSTAGSPDVGAAGAGDTLPPAPAAIVCPDPDPFHPAATSVSVQGAVLTADAHWTADKTYLIFDDYALDNHVLTVDAGTVICMSNQAQLEVGRGGNSPGEIHLNGTAAKPVTITAFPSSTDPTKPDSPHQGLKFDTYQKSVISYTNIWYGGGSAYAFEMTDTARDDNTVDDPTKPLLIDHLTIGGVQSRGLRIGPEVGLDPASSIRFTGYSPPDGSSPAPDAMVEVNVFSEKSLTAVLEFDKPNVPKAAQKFRLVTGAPPSIIDKDAEFADPGVDLYYIEGNNLIISSQEQGDPAPTLTIDAGVTLHNSADIRVGDIHGGNLVLAGTAAKPVTITSAEDTPAAGDWEGIYFFPNMFDPAVSKITHAQILYAGNSQDDPMNATFHVEQCGDPDFAFGAILIGGTQPTYAGPAITNTLIAHSLSNGIAADTGANGVHCTTDYTAAALGNTFQDIAVKNILTATTACTP
jgi:hypothetical protein